MIVGIFHPDGGTTGEFIFEWIPLSNGEKPWAKLKSFDDSWSALLECRDMLEMMKEIDGQNIQEPEFCEMLKKLGYKDDTEYKETHMTKKEIIAKMRDGGTLANRGTGYWLTEPREKYRPIESIEIDEKLVKEMELEGLIKLTIPYNSIIAELCE